MFKNFYFYSKIFFRGKTIFSSYTIMNLKYLQNKSYSKNNWCKTKNRKNHHQRIRKQISSSFPCSVKIWNQKCSKKWDHKNNLKVFSFFLVLIKFLIFPKDFFKSISITIISKIFFPIMRWIHFLCMFYRTPIFFCSSSYFHSISKKSIYIRTINTIQLFNPV